jgi:hypothetical protein
VADNDYSVLPERLITLGCIWRYKRALGLDYSEEFRTYEKEIARVESQNLTYKDVFIGAPRYDAIYGGPYIIGPIIFQ